MHFFIKIQGFTNNRKRVGQGLAPAGHKGGLAPAEQKQPAEKICRKPFVQYVKKYAVIYFLLQIQEFTNNHKLVGQGLAPAEHKVGLLLPYISSGGKYSPSILSRTFGYIRSGFEMLFINAILSTVVLNRFAICVSVSNLLMP